MYLDGFREIAIRAVIVRYRGESFHDTEIGVGKRSLVSLVIRRHASDALLSLMNRE